MKTHFLAKTQASWLMASSFLCLTSIGAFAQTTQSSSDLTTQQSSSDDTATNVNLSPVVVKGKSDPILDAAKVDPDKDYTNVGKSRVLTTTINRETLIDRQIDDLEDFSRRVDASVNFNEDSSSLNMRGLDRNRVLVTVDGIRQPFSNDGAYAGGSPTQQGGVGYFDFNSMGGIDIIKSSDSSFFGTGALGGVLAFRTLNPEDILKPGKTFGNSTKATYAGQKEAAILNQSFAARYKNTLFLLSGGYQNGSETGNRGETGGQGKNRTKANPAHYVQGSFLGKIRHYFSGGHRLDLTGEWYDLNNHEHTLTSQTAVGQDYHTNTENQRSRFSANYDYIAENPKDLFGEGHFTAYWQDQNTMTNTTNYNSKRPASNVWQDLKLNTQTYGALGSATVNAYTGSVHHAITFGGEAYLSDTSQKQRGWRATPSPFVHNNYADMPDVHGTDLSAMLQDRISLGKNDWLHLTPGVRFDYYKRDPHDTKDYQNNPGYTGSSSGASGSRYSPKFLAEARVAKKLTAYALYSQSYRAPSATEQYLSYSTAPFYSASGNPNLKAENGRGWEVGLKYGDSKRGANVAFYDNYYKNFIDMMGVTPCSYMQCFGYTNLKSVRIYGLEANVNWEFDKHWHSWGSFAYTKGRDTDMDYNLASVAPFRGIVGFGYKQENWGSDLSSTFAIARDNAKYMTSTGTPSKQWNTPGYVLFDLTGWYRPAFYKPLKIQAGMYNMFDKKYYNATSLPIGQSASGMRQQFYSQPGRYFKVTARIDF
ncbi:TonB-dependent hemoglobin/transferrin/lactoferrin family receptor [Commensalibacter papalotli (ex Botero et al. 2024)]|uniref:Fe transport (CirA) (PDB:1BY3) n=1 Tax=Commensalibacter papalotli (ex Botero et al. 2024) TaxID=2972766 RepID=A0ABN8WAF6_9PROT|nr:TonB-dependent hemoglobin/transferrin/lactoferrin family receptor [Commensalibacter papalotli (ex Botero et al. 2024)]CAI3934356.1 Fe transport (CirA) (PDB:1BY3) [Commensalibacter papalotli (ex Botero et al. 2024)]CAI3950457.1 Fe transport (CirA) (PDB:1BY3) [Commensalibacter papalotli (ex Botero et al. 2024)]